MIIKSEVITSRNNPIVKWAASLCEKKGRTENQRFIAEGEKLTFEAIKCGLPITHIFLSEKNRDAILKKIKENESSQLDDTEIFVLSDSAFEKISTEKAPQGVISVIKYLDFFRNMDIIYKEEFFLRSDERALALCSVRDPSNLGAVIRSAAAFGIDHIVLTCDTADVYNPKTVRSAMGSLFKIKITAVSDFSSFIKAAKECSRRVFAAELTDMAIPLSDISLLPGDIFVIGNEGHGIPKEISSLCNGSVYIPISEKTESLNASVAASLFMWEQAKV